MGSSLAKKIIKKHLVSGKMSPGEEIAIKIMNAKPQQTYVFFNNDHAMLKNSREMLAILNRLLYD